MLTFGIEIEVLLKPKEPIISSLRRRGWRRSIDSGERVPSNARQHEHRALQESNRQVLWSLVASQLRSAGVLAQAIHEFDIRGSLHDYYSVWQVGDESTITERRGFWRVEISSRILSPSEDWQGEVSRVFTALSDNYELRTTDDCALHVHVGGKIWDEYSNQYFPEPVQYSKEQLQNVAKAVFLFEEATTMMMPENRKNCQYALPNHKSDNTPEVLKNHYRSVPQATWAGLFDYLDASSDIDDLNQRLGIERWRSWSFTQTYSPGVLKTVEFRRPPGAVHENDACYWAKFALGFVNAATMCDLSPYRSWTTSPTFDELCLFVQSGLDPLGPTYHNTIYRS